MSVRKIYEVKGGAYFYSARLYNGAPLFYQARYRDIILQSLTWLQKKRRLSLWAFVVMPTHVHFVFSPLHPHRVAEVSKAFGSFTAHRILEEIRNDDVYRYFKNSARFKRSGDRQHCIWGSNLLITLNSELYVRQKIEYVHNNPVRKGWNLCEDRGRYAYSSAMLYDYGIEPVVPVKKFHCGLVSARTPST